jgi:hypothetical protein
MRSISPSPAESPARRALARSGSSRRARNSSFFRSPVLTAIGSRTLRKTPAVGLTAEGAELHTDAKPIDDPAAVDHVVEAFGAKYGADRVEEYYPKHDVAVEVPLA